MLLMSIKPKKYDNELLLSLSRALCGEYLGAMGYCHCDENELFSSCTLTCSKSYKHLDLSVFVYFELYTCCRLYYCLFDTKEKLC